MQVRVIAIVRVLRSTLGLFSTGKIGPRKEYHHTREVKTSRSVALNYVYVACGRFLKYAWF